MRARTMLLLVFAILAGLLAALPLHGEPPLPELRIQATDGGSVLHVKNLHTQPLTAFLIELVDYPGSSFSLWQDDAAGEPVAPGSVREIPITNMTVGAAPEYVKMRAATYADGSTAGIPEKAKQLVERRHFTLETTGKLIENLTKAKSENKSAEAVAAELDAWRDGLPQATRRNRNSQEAINNNAARALLSEVSETVRKQSVDVAIRDLAERERALRQNKP